MDTPIDATALKSDSDGSANLITAVSSSAEEQRSNAECTFTDVKLPANGEVMSESISGNSCTKGNIPSLSLAMCENNPVKAVEDKIITDCHDMDTDDSHACSNLVSRTGADVAGTNDDDGEIADSRSQTPLQDEVEPEPEPKLIQNQVAETSVTKLDQSTVVNRSGDYIMKTKSECTEENGEVSDDDDDDDDEGMMNSKGNTDSVNQLLPVDVKPLEEEKATKELEKQKVCLGFV